MDFKFVESNIFTALVAGILEDDEHLQLQSYLIKHPAGGVLIPGGHGLRKLRWKTTGKGKRGGIRLIYYLYSSANTIFMVYLFRKSEKSDLTPSQLRLLAADFRSKGEIA